jgi:hypothetical protein
MQINKENQWALKKLLTDKFNNALRKLAEGFTVTNRIPYEIGISVTENQLNLMLQEHHIPRKTP